MLSERERERDGENEWEGVEEDERIWIDREVEQGKDKKKERKMTDDITKTHK